MSAALCAFHWTSACIGAMKNSPSGKPQIPPDLVVKIQAIDIVEVIL
jgi:hypothetical protein